MYNRVLQHNRVKIVLLKIDCSAFPEIKELNFLPFKFINDLNTSNMIKIILKAQNDIFLL